MATKLFSKQPAYSNEGYAQLAELCRRATAKDLRSPDERLKQQVRC